MIGTPVCERHETLGELPAYATHAEPGSKDKLAILAERARNGESLFHPEDTQDSESSLSSWLARRRLVSLLLNDLCV